MAGEAQQPKPASVVAVTSISQGHVLAFLEDGRVVHGKFIGPAKVEWTGVQEPVPGTPAEQGGGDIDWR